MWVGWFWRLEGFRWSRWDGHSLLPRLDNQPPLHANDRHQVRFIDEHPTWRRCQFDLQSDWVVSHLAQLAVYLSLQKLDRRLIEASRDLGARAYHIFFHIMLPLTMPGIIAGSTMVFLPALGLFYIPDLLGGARSMLIGNFIKDQFLTTSNWPLGSAASVLLTILMFMMLFWYYLVSRRANQGDMKELA